MSLAGEHSRYDTKNRDVTPPELESRLVQSLDALLPQVDAVIALDQVSEQNCGVITATVAAAISDRARRYPGVVFCADSRRKIRQFQSVIIKLNQFEALGVENPTPDTTVDLGELQEAVRRLRAWTNAAVLVSRGAEGMLVSDPELTFVPGVRVAGPTDPTGAGDSAMAGAVLGLAAGATPAEAALLGNLVASITVQQLVR